MKDDASFFRLSIRPWGLVISAGVLTCAATVLGFFGFAAWFLDLFSHFRVQYCVGLTVVALLLLAVRKHKAAACFGLFAVVNFCTIFSMFIGESSGVSAPKITLRAMLLNVNTQTGDPVRVAKVLRDKAPDIVALEEVDDRWIAELRPALEAYAYSKVEPRSDNFGIALYSKHPIIQAEVVYLCDAEVPTIIAELKSPIGPLTVIATHPLPPKNASYARSRNEQLTKLSECVHAAKSPVLLLGDLNASPWSRDFKSLRERSNLRDSAAGRGIQPTWPSYMPLLLIPIDHCLHSEEISIVKRQIGPNVGSDHYPVIVDFGFKDEPHGSIEPPRHKDTKNANKVK